MNEQGLKIAHDALLVDIDTLKQVLEDQSSMCHKYSIASQSKNRIKVGYSNPDEYGSYDWVYAVYPVYSYSAFGRKTTMVVLDLVNVVNDPEDIHADSFYFIGQEIRKSMGIPSVYDAIKQLDAHAGEPKDCGMEGDTWYHALQKTL